jgi:hypothetical protein
VAGTRIGRILIDNVQEVPVALGELSVDDKVRVNSAVVKAEEFTGLEFCVIIGIKPNEEPRHEAERAFHKAKMNERPSVLVMITPSARTLEVVVASELSARLTDQACEEAVQLMTGMFATEDIVGGLERGIGVLAERAGPRTDGRHGHVGEDLPNIVDIQDPDQ